MATFTVTTSADAGAGSLRAAVAAANARAGADVIAFDAAVFDGGSEDLIWLTSGQIEITDGLTITGGPAGVTITGDAAGDDVTLAGGITDVAASGEARLDDNSRIFDATAALTIDGLTLTGGHTAGAGGAVYSSTTVTLEDSSISGNSTTGDYSRGGGVYSRGVTLTNSTVSGNITAGDFSDGGGVWGYGGVTLTNSTINDNSTAGENALGGGVSGLRGITLTNSTVSGNSTAGVGSEGGGIYGSFGGVTLTNSIMLGNATVFTGVDGDEIEGDLTLTGGNIVGGNLFDGDAHVGDVAAEEVFAATTEIAPGVLAGMLADNGGPTRTILIAADGPAVDAGGATALPIDQRGLERVSGAAVDLGAVELGAGPGEPSSLVVTTALDVVANDGLTSLREAAFFANFEPGTDTITFDASVFDGEAGDAIRLTGGQIEITEALIIEGGAAGVTITGDASGDDVTLAGGITDVAASGATRLDDNSRIFNTTAALTLDGLTLTGGRTTADFAGGGAVRANGTTVTLTDSVVTGNSTLGAYSGGGGVSGGDVTLTDSVVSGNSTLGAYSGGGGVSGGDVTLTDSVVSGNSTAGDYSRGGGIAGLNVTLTNSTVNGNSTLGAYSGGGGAWGDGVTLTNSVVNGNITAGNFSGGGGIGGNVALINSMVSGNSTTGRSSGGGGVWGGEVTLTNSMVSDNSTAGDYSGGGGVSGGDVTLTNSTVNGNSTAGDYSRGGGVGGGAVTLTNTTVSDNSTAGDDSNGGGISGYGGFTLTNSTISGNSTAGVRAGGGGIYVGGLYGDFTLTNSIVLGNVTVFASGDEVEGDFTLTGGNIVGGNLFDGDADVGNVAAEEVFAATTEIAPGVLAGMLADNGGPTRTILIAADGPAVDAGGATALPIDQRGLERVSGGAVDLGAVELGAGPAEPGSLIVTTARDVVANDGLTSLREAAFFANLEPETDTITFDASVFDGKARDVIRLTGGQIEITEALIIEGGAAGVTITGDASGDDVTLAGGITDVETSGEDRLDDNSRIFNTTAGLTLDGLTLTGGRTTADFAGGGAVRANGTTVTLTNSVVSGNSTLGDGANGGGVSGSSVSLTNSVVSGNSTMGDGASGGGTSGYGDVTLINSTVSDNSTAGDGASGGGVDGDVALTNSTISGNSTAGDSASGGGVSGYRVSLTNSTVSGNSTMGDYSRGSGVYIFYGYGGNGDVTLTNSIVLGNATIFAGGSSDEVVGAITQTGGNILGGDLFDGETDVGDVTAAEVFAATAEIAPGVFAGVLADNNGPTRTIAIRAEGPAAGAADPTNATETDQRGFARDDAPDLGAFEAGAVGGLQLFGGPGADVLVGEAGGDRLWGRGGNDLLRGRAGEDLLRGGTGDDVISGGTGGDRISGGMGDDMLSGGKGQDVFVFRPDPGADTIVTFDANARGGQDKMDLSGLGISATSFASAVTIAQVGDDTLIKLQGEGSILCTGIDGEGVAVIDQSDFLLLA